MTIPVLRCQVKYKKHKKKQLNGTMNKMDCKPKALEMQTSVPPGLFAAGNILKTALTNPTEVSEPAVRGQ